MLDSHDKYCFQRSVLILSFIFLLSGCGCTGNLLLGNAEFENYMQKHIGDNLSDKTGPISIENLLKYGKYVRDIPEPRFQSLMKYDENLLIYKSNTQPFVISYGEKCNVSLIVDKDTLVIKSFVYESSRSSCSVSKFFCGA